MSTELNHIERYSEGGAELLTKKSTKNSSSALVSISTD